jgi:DNA polymerase II small subunit
MEKQEIIDAFLEKGKLLTPNALEFLTGKNIEPLLKNTENGIYPTLVLDESTLSMQDNIRIIKNLSTKKKEITTEDFIKFYKSKYEKMKDVIIQRLQKDFVSLNKLDARRDEVHIIGIVKDIKKHDNKKIVELEDMTTTVPVLFDEIDDTDDIELDDVIAVRAVSAGKILYGKKILWPDLPLRQPAKGFGKACFISDLHLDETPEQDFIKFIEWFSNQNIKYLFVAGDIGDNRLFEKIIDKYCTNKKTFTIPGNIDNDAYPQLPEHFESRHIIPLSNPAMAEINGIKILLIHDMNINMFKKRYLGKSKTILPEDYLVLEEVPDIVHYGHTHEAQVSNYKSTTLVNSGSMLTQFMPVIIDFSTREVEQIELEKI